MANWCNCILICESEAVIEDILHNYIDDSEGYLPTFIQPDEQSSHYMFNISWNFENKTIMFSTKWTINEDEIAKIARCLGTQLFCSFEEQGCGIFGELTAFSDGTFEKVLLDSDTVESIIYNEETDMYVWLVDEYESWSELCGMLLTEQKAGW